MVVLIVVYMVKFFTVMGPKKEMSFILVISLHQIKHIQMLQHHQAVNLWSYGKKMEIFLVKS